MPKWILILFSILPKKALGEMILQVLKDFAKKTKVQWDDEFLENLDKWLRANEILDPLRIVKLKEDLKKDKISRNKE